MSRDRPEQRGQTAVIGVVLLIGLVAIASVGILVIGGNAQDNAKDQVNREKVEQAFRQLDKQVDSVARSDSRYREVDFDLPLATDSAVRHENAGEVVIERTNVTGYSTKVVVQNIGSLVYDRGNVHYAYQAGAVWSGEGNDTQLVSAPDIVYATTSEGDDPTLTMPITELEGPSRINTGGVQIRKLRTRAPVNNVSTIENQVVTLTITSDYYVGWGRYFEDRYEDVIVTYDHPNERVVIKLGTRDIPGTWNTAIGTDGDVVFDASGNDSIRGNITTGGNFTDGSGGQGTQPVSCDADGDGNFDESGSDCVTEGEEPNAPLLDSAIASKTESILEACAAGEADLECYPNDGLDDFSGDLQGGTTYYFGEDSYITSTVAADLSSGNVTVILDGDLALDAAGIRSENGAGTDHSLRLYFNGTDMAVGGQGFVSNDDVNSTRNQIYGTSEFHLNVGQINNGEGWYAAVYAPGEASTNTNHAKSLDSSLNSVFDCSFDICIGNGADTVHGAIVAGSVELSNSVSFEYDTDLRHTERTLGASGAVPPPLTFLQVSVNKVCVGDTGC